MIWALCVVFASLFGFALGLFFGAGNYGGLKGAIIPGVIAGVVASIPAIREQQWTFVALASSFALAGSIICVWVPHTSGLKRFCREQELLALHLGSYKLGKLYSEPKK